MIPNKIIDCGWGKLIFSQTFTKEETLYKKLIEEPEGTKNIATYSENAHILIAQYPQEIFIDPSYIYRKPIDPSMDLDLAPPNLNTREARFPEDLEMINDIYLSQSFLPLPDGFFPEPALKFFLSEDKNTQEILGLCMWIDHTEAFDDPEKGSSFWALAVYPTSTIPGIGQSLVLKCLQTSKDNDNAFLDLSVIHSNHQAISLYEKLGFEKTGILSLKNKSKLNEKLFIGLLPEGNLNIRSKVIIEGARKRGIFTEIIDEKGFFTLSFGGKQITCYESLTDITNAIALKYCDNHHLFNIVLKQAELSVPTQEEFTGFVPAEKFLNTHGNIVLRVLKGTKINGITVDIKTAAELKYALEKAKKYGDRFLLEESVEGERFRFLLINFEVVSILEVMEPFLIGTGKHSIRKLLQKLNRRQSGLYDDMRIPIDKELRSCLKVYNYDLDSVPLTNEKIILRKYANPKTGEFLKNINLDSIDPAHIRAAENAAKVLNIPIVSIEMKIHNKKYTIIQANERPSLAPPHEANVINLFLEFLFPQLIPQNS